MQLARPAVGYGVYESKVETGRLDRHPVKRTRTTLTYLAVASLATDEEKKLYRRAVNGSHKHVRSDENSAVEYNAFDPELQLWVAACLYRGFEDVYKILYGDLDPVTRDAFYQRSATFGTTLQMRRDMWPADRDAFEVYWNENLDKVAIDETIREHLYGIASATFTPKLLHPVVGPLNRFVTTGSCPKPFVTKCGSRGQCVSSVTSTDPCASPRWSIGSVRRFCGCFPTTSISGICVGASPRESRWSEPTLALEVIDTTGESDTYST